MRDVNAGDTTVDTLVLADGLGLDRIAVDDGRVTLGAAVSMAAIARHPGLAFLKPVAGAIGGPAVRAMATVGGNLFAPYPHGDFAVVFRDLPEASRLQCQHFERLPQRIDEPRVPDAFACVDVQLFPAIDVFRRRRQHLANPIRRERQVRLVWRRRESLAPPTG